MSMLYVHSSANVYAVSPRQMGAEPQTCKASYRVMHSANAYSAIELDGAGQLPQSVPFDSIGLIREGR